MEADDVVVTGIGMVTPLGTTAPASAQAWRRGDCSSRHTLPELAETRLARAEAVVSLPLNAAERLGSRRMLKYMSDAAVLGCVAAHEAASDAELQRRFCPENVGLYAATGLASADVRQAGFLIQESTDTDGRFSCRLLGQRGLAATDPLLSFKILANTPPCLVSIQENIKGPNYIFTPWEGQAASALVEAWQAVAAGEVACALVGASDTPAHPATLVYLRQARLLNDGECPANAAAYLVFERLGSARRDNRRIYARIAAMKLSRANGAIHDPLAARMGRTFAAAPAVLLALACLAHECDVSLCGVDGQCLTVRLEEAA